MTGSHVRWLAVVVLLFAAAACADSTQPLDPRPAADALGVPVELRVSPRGAFGGLICAGMPDGLEFDVGLMSEFSSGGYASATLTCPAKQVVFAIDSDTRYELFVEQRDSIWSWPRLSLKRDTIHAPADTLVLLRAAQGAQLAGRAMLNGAPLAGESLLALRARGAYVDDFGLPSASSDSLGHWIDRASRGPVRLQAGVEYARHCRPDHGMRLAAGPDPDQYDRFPNEWRAVTCRFATSRSARHTHHATALQVTPEAGVVDPDIGNDADGYGFGVAYPTGDSLVLGQNLLPYGALLFAIDQDAQIWTPWDRADLTGCASSDPVDCAFYAPTRGPLVANEGDALRVRFEMSDSGAGPVRVRVVQTSWDGAYGDYVLYRVTFVNESDDVQTLFPAWHLDWNLTGGGDGSSDVAGSTSGGRLYWVTDGTRYLGSYLPTPFPLRARRAAECCGIAGPLGSLSYANDVMRGFIVGFSAGPGDVTVTQGTLLHVPAGGIRTFWFALMGAGSVAELESLATQIEAEVALRRAGGTP